MVITGGNDTLGDTADAAKGGTRLDASGDIVSDRNSMQVANGRSTNDFDRESNRDIHTLFLVLPASQGNLTVIATSVALITDLTLSIQNDSLIKGIPIG